MFSYSIKYIFDLVFLDFKSLAYFDYRFATRSALSGAQSASLDETLNDLDDLETRVIKTLVPDNGSEAVVTRVTISRIEF